MILNPAPVLPSPSPNKYLENFKKIKVGRTATRTSKKLTRRCSKQVFLVSDNPAKEYTDPENFFKPDKYTCTNGSPRRQRKKKK